MLVDNSFVDVALRMCLVVFCFEIILVIFPPSSLVFHCASSSSASAAERGHKELSGML